MRYLLLTIPLLLFNFTGISQVSKIEPGFSKIEYAELLKISTRQSERYLGNIHKIESEVF